MRETKLSIFIAIIFEIIFAILLIILGIAIIINTFGIRVLIAFLSGFLINVPAEIIIIIGIAFIIIGIAFLALVPIKTLLRLRSYKEEKIQYEEKQDYMNPSWLKHQYYDLGKSLQDIADEQNVSMITIRKWVDKLGLASEDLNYKDNK